MKGFTIHTIRKSIQSLPSALKVFSIRWIRKDNLTVKLLVQLLLPALMWYFQEVSPDFLTEFVPSDFSLWEFNQIIQSLSVYPTSQNQNSHWSAFHLPTRPRNYIIREGLLSWCLLKLLPLYMKLYSGHCCFVLI